MIRSFRCFLLLALLIAVCAAGCKSSSTPTVVSGKVTYNGGPVTGGIIRFGAASGENANAIYQGTINEDGSYSVSEVPQGDMIVWIDTEAINPEPLGRPKGISYGQPGQKDQAQANDQDAMLKKMKEMGMAPADAGTKTGKYMKIPEKYWDKKKSELRVTTKGGKQTYNPELKD
jgi:hypothetical protein